MQTIMIVDDEEINRVTLEAGFADLYETIRAADGVEAVRYLNSGIQIDAILLDLNMPALNGFDVLSFMNKTGSITKIPVFVVTGTNNPAILNTAFNLGAVDVVEKPYNIQVLRRRLVNIIELFRQRRNFATMVEEQLEGSKSQNKKLVQAMADMVEFRCKESGVHVKNICAFTRILLSALIKEDEQYRYLKDDIEAISFAACLHDIGKNAIPDYILSKKGLLTEQEFALLETHTVRGYEQIIAFKDILEPSLYNYSLDIVRHHHERYDGKGYPDGLEGDKITIWSQIVGISDVYNALTSDRCYQATFDHDTAVKMILNGDCGTFSPQILDLFIRHADSLNNMRLSIANNSAGARRKLLIIDDSEIDRQLLQTILETEFDVISVDNAKDGLNLVNDPRQIFNAILVDLMMPEIDGFKTVELLGKRYIKNVPAILMSADANQEFIIKAADLGVSAYIKKPFEPEIVIKKIKGLLHLT